jgi:hypothetical protein
MATILLYVDPGSGSYLVQVIIAAILGVVFYFKAIWFRVKVFFGGKRKEPPPVNPEEHD